MIRLRSVVVTLFALAAPPLAGLAAAASPPELASFSEAAEPIGRTDVTLFGLRLYRAELWTPGAEPFAWDRPFALALTYRRDFTASELANASIDEIARIRGGAPEDYAELAPLLAGCFADVSEDDRITGVSLSEDEAAFFLNGAESCRVAYPEFRRLFFGIWLGDDTRDPQGARELLGATYTAGDPDAGAKCEPRSGGCFRLLFR